MELKKNKTNKTSLDVTCENRHEVPRQKKLLIGCGGGFQQECSQSYSPVARWITEMAQSQLDQEGQQRALDAQWQFPHQTYGLERQCT